MERRSFLKTIGTGIAGIGAGSSIYPSLKTEKSNLVHQGAITTRDTDISYYHSAVDQPLKIILASDTHLWRNDERGDPYRQYSDRMAAAYNQTRHFQTGELTNPEECLENTIRIAVEEDADLIALPGDLFSWPSEAAIEWALEKLEAVDIPYIYTSGNHDWHYEGMEGTIEELRETWINKRLLPFYHGNDPMMAAYDLKGIRIVTIDDSTYQISDDQLAFFRDQVKSGMPLILMMHIPLYAPGRPVGFGCGHPDWGAATDRIYELERRPRWPVDGHSRTTFNFYREVFNAPNLLGIFAGHIHRPSMEYVNGIPQFVADDNASGAYLNISLMPLADRDSDLMRI